MTIGMRRLALSAALLLLVAGVADHANGFFPRGGFNFNQQLRYATWSFTEFDTNENGVIEPGEGLEFRIEGGPRGFTRAEIEQVKAAFKTWQDVPTSYASFRFSGVIEDPIVPASMTSPDYLPMVFMQVTDVAEGDGYSELDPPEVIIPQLAGLPAITLTAYTIDITAVPVGGNAVIVPAGTILDCDIVVNASLHRPGLGIDTTYGTLDLQATVTQQVGYLLGLSATPLNNLDPNFNLDGPTVFPVERAVLQMTGADGVPRMVGATPTMFPLYFLTEMDDGTYVAGWRDLAPDDISGVSWLYPREDGLENFFSIQQEARTQVRPATGIPPAPISGAHIVAWADVGEGSPGRRVPLFSTMTGLYQLYPNIQLSGRFNLMGLWKQLEEPGRKDMLFEPSYVITMSPLDGRGYDRQAPPGFTALSFDSIQGAFALHYLIHQVTGPVPPPTRPPDYFSTNYPSEVFNEDGNIYGVDNYFAGTPLVWSFERNALISANSSKTLPRMLPRNVPMFGSPDRVCPMNIIENPDGGTLPTGIAGLNDKLRGFRDDTLLGSAVGTAVVDLYYRAAPYLAWQLLEHEDALRAARGGVLLLLWMWERAALLFVSTLLLVVAAYTSVKARRQRRLVAGGIVVIAVLLGIAAAANAGQIPMTTEELVAQSTHVVSGKVLSAEGFVAQNGRIYTEVVFEITDVAQGDLNRGQRLSFAVIGGTHGSIALAATGIPRFEAGEHAVLHLLEVPDYGLIPYGGMRSKIPVYVDPETEEEMVVIEDDGVESDNGTEAEGETSPEQEEGEDNADEETSVEGEGEDGNEEKSAIRSAGTVRETPRGRVPLRDYMRYLRAIANSQR